MLNRDLVVVRLKQPFVDWVNEADPYSDGSCITLKEINEDLPTFLIHGYASEDKAKAGNAELLHEGGGTGGQGG